MCVSGDLRDIGGGWHLNRLLEAVVTSASDAVLITDASSLDAQDGGPRIVYVNEAFTRMTGYAPEDVVGRTPRLLQCPDTDGAQLRRIRLALERWAPLECELLNRRKDGRDFWVQISLAPAIDADGQYTHWVSIQRDITLRKAQDLVAERAVQGVRERLRGAFAHAPIGMAIADPDGNLLEVNAALTDLLGRPAQALTGTSLAEITHVDDREAARVACRSLSATGVASRHEARLVHADGRLVRVVVHGALVRDPDGAPDHVILHIEDVSERHAMEGELVRMALSDVLTQLPNRTMLLDRLAQAAARRNRDRSPLAVLFVDLDGFKDVNDRLGHAAGDAVLVALARRLQHAVRPGDTVARIGGDEFVVVCEHADSDEADLIARRLVEVASAADDAEAGVTPTSVSVGVAVAAESDPVVPESLLNDADVAMYEAKRLGRGRWVRFGPKLRAQTALRRVLEGEIEAGMSAGEFVLHYQPQIDIRTDAVIGAEALVRWQHPQHGLMGPDQFVPVAERSGAIVELGAWVIGQACADAAATGGDGVVWVNVSAQQLRHGFVAEVVAVADAAGLPPARLGLELTESVLLEDLRTARRLLNELRATGVQLAIDDFGTGYSSLAYLADLPVSTVKVDRSFATRLEPGGRGRPVVIAILGIAVALGLVTIVEGVETPQQLEILQDLGVEQAQGYLFGKPAPGLRDALERHPERVG